MGKVKKFRKWRNYDKEDWRIEQYCKKECEACRIEQNGQAFCYGKFKIIATNEYITGSGRECTLMINTCFDPKYKQEEK